MTAPDRLAADIAAAYRERRLIPPPSSADAAFDLASAYAVERERVLLRAREGRRPVGRKVGYANKAVWRALKLDTLAWAHMYDDTVRFASEGEAVLPIERMLAPRIEPEIVFKLKRPLADAPIRDDAAAVLRATEWLALGFEIIDCVYPDWRYQPADFVAAAGLHVALVVGQPTPVTSDATDRLIAELPRFTLQLARGGALVEEGSGRNSLRSPAVCVAELAALLASQPSTTPLSAGELISSGSLTAAQPLAAGETWAASVSGLDVQPLTLRVI